MTGSRKMACLSCPHRDAQTGSCSSWCGEEEVLYLRDKKTLQKNDTGITTAPRSFQFSQIVSYRSGTPGSWHTVAGCRIQGKRGKLLLTKQNGLLDSSSFEVSDLQVNHDDHVQADEKYILSNVSFWIVATTKTL